MEYKLDYSSLNETFQRLNKINSVALPHIAQALDKSASEVVTLANTVLRAKLYGVSEYGVSELRPNDSIFNNWDAEKPVVNEGNYLVKTLYNWSPHAQAVEYGTLKSAPIEPRYAPVLKFKYAGFDMTAMSVRGQHPKHFVSESINNSYIKRIIENLHKDAFLSAWSEI